MTNSPIAAPEFSFFWTLLQQLLDRESFSGNQAAQLMQGCLNEAIPPEISGAILTALHFKGISADELVSAAKDILQSGAAWVKLEHLVEFLGN